ncbi:MAG: ribonuclease III [Puniceicoccaceae bacterium]
MADGDKDMAPLEERIGYRFADRELLHRSLTHPSHHGESVQGNYQRLEFLGDAVLGLVLAEELFKTQPDKREGALTRCRSMLVKGRQLSKLAKEIDLGEYLLIGSAEAAQGGRSRNSILEDAFEAMIGAVYIDGGLESARQVALGIYGDLEARLDLQADVHNPKGKLQELLQPSLGNDSIEYRVTEESGPDHQKRFTVEVWIDGERRGGGTGNSKKLAEEAAAREALEDIDPAGQ